MSEEDNDDIKNAIETALAGEGDVTVDVTVEVTDIGGGEVSGYSGDISGDVSGDIGGDVSGYSGDDTNAVETPKKPAKGVKGIKDVKGVKKEKPEKPAVKKTVGRPRKNRNVAPVVVQGVVAQPVNNGDIIELVYCKPLLFQKIINLLKIYKVSEVDLQFDKAGLTIDTKVADIKITIKIAGAGMNIYYCAEPMRVWIKCSDLERAHSMLNKEHYKITWLIKFDCKHIMYVIIKESEYESDDINEIEVYEKEKVENDNSIYDDTEYPLKFKLSASHFKKKIEDAYKLSNQTALVIEKTGDESLQLSYDTKKAQKNARTVVYNNDAKISLISKLGPDDVFRVSVSVAHIVPFSKTIIGNDVYIAAHRERKISFMSLADRHDGGWTASVKIFSDIVG